MFDIVRYAIPSQEPIASEAINPARKHTVVNFLNQYNFYLHFQ